MTLEPRIMVVEDYEPLRESLAATLRAEGYDVHALADGLGFPAALEGFRPDIVLLDVWLPVGPDGFSLARLVRSKGDVPVLFLTAAADLPSQLSGFDAGGDDYVTKPFAIPELLARIRALLRRAGVTRDRVHRISDLVVDEAARVVSRGDEAVDLTPTEFALLLEFVRRPGRVLSKPRLLGLVWDSHDHHVNLVEAHVSALRRKLERHGPRLVHTVRRGGYVLRA